MKMQNPLMKGDNFTEIQLHCCSCPPHPHVLALPMKKIRQQTDRKECLQEIHSRTLNQYTQLIHS